jgi:acyl-CoA thioesterase-2
MTASWSSHAGGVPHSVHAHFLGEGSTTAAVDYHGQVLRASRRFTTMWMTATQGATLLCSATVSFHTPERSPAHEGHHRLPAGDPAAAEPAAGGPIPASSGATRADFDLRAAHGAARDDTGRPALGYWLRTRSPLGSSPALQAAALAWASDLTLTRVVDLEHEWRGPEDRRAASLDHAVWFHRVPDLAAWHHYEVVSPVYRSALALSTGRVVDLAGHLVATTTQESLLRRSPHARRTE